MIEMDECCRRKAISETMRILRRPAKPPDWDPTLTAEAVKEQLRRELEAVDGKNRFGGKR